MTCKSMLVAFLPKNFTSNIELKLFFCLYDLNIRQIQDQRIVSSVFSVGIRVIEKYFLGKHVFHWRIWKFNTLQT